MDKDIKERFRDYRLKSQELHYEADRIEYIRQSMIPSSPIISDMPKGNGSNAGYADKFARIEEIEARMIEISEYLKEERAELEKVIEGGIRSSEQKAVIRARYFDLMDWKVISRMVYGNDYDYELRKLDYLELTHGLHYRALNAMRKYLSRVA